MNVGGFEKCCSSSMTNSLQWSWKKPNGKRLSLCRFQRAVFTTKYKLYTEWSNDKVILYFHQPSPLQMKSLQEKFPLMDVLVANMEYHHQDYAAYMQQYRLPADMTTFVEKNIQNCSQTECSGCCKRTMQTEASQWMLPSEHFFLPI